MTASPATAVPHDLRADLILHFRLGRHSIHGPAHWERVQAHAERLAAASGGDVSVARYFAWFHDAERHDEWYDTGHGERAATLVRAWRTRLPLSDAQVDLLARACARHELGELSADPTIGACWDADRLELTRVGIQPDARYMSTAAGKAACTPGT
ncbi:hypothetical protein GCM10008959_38180 [Deinococcus seoulensis]|uniref:HD domain-containing protein n=1 Tax=Deinococcus seoulensis TaxID=1837379 RepID=A0ABQ2S0J5_9DEIO|nr:hypothetical protein [Deinococcus seoulensis]GGR73143.1 hypothetical protein GCM10008959_38180 [Deinococcus seoulensis]